MLVFIENTPRAYAWGSTDALPEMLGHAPTGEPQAELWLGDHPGSPAKLAKGAPLSLIELIESDPERYGVNGGSLPFLLKILAIGAPLSLQAHPNLAQAQDGFARENAAGIPIDAAERNYRDANHKPELLVALSQVTALSGFRDLADAVADMHRIGAAVHAPALVRAADRLLAGDAGSARHAFLEWAFSEDASVAEALAAIARVVAGGAHDVVDAERLACLTELTEHYPGDPGALVSLLLHHVTLDPGEAIYLGARQLHAYLGGIAVEVMAASDNVLRAGLTNKHVDSAEMLRLLDFSELDEPRLHCEPLAPGLNAWRPAVPDFQLFRARVSEEGTTHPHVIPAHAPHRLFRDAAIDEFAPEVVIEAAGPLVLVATSGRIRVKRLGEFSEMANVARGQSLYISAGEPIHISGNGEAFLAAVGAASA